MSSCEQCGKIVKKFSNRYCSNKCQVDFQHVVYIAKWKQGLVNGSRVTSTRNISRHILRYLGEKYNNACSVCGWNKINPVTGKVPLEIDHIDGNSDNNTENNLRLLCPNCHSLTAHFRNLNKGNGRSWRRAKYVKLNA